MARVSFSALVEEIVGKLAGSVFQDSYGGMQIRTRVSPRNPQTKYQQLRRGEFGYLSAGWRFLTSVQRQTFIDAAVTPPAALNLYLQSNINLTLINEPTITDYVPSSDPGTMPIEFSTAEPGNLSIIASGSPTTVPAGTKLLLQITYQKPPTRIFTNPSQFSPVISFDEGTDLSTATNVIAEWTARYGVFLPNKRLCLKSSVIDKSNGLRGADVVSCTISEEVTKFVKIYTDVTQPTTAGTGSTSLSTFSIPANTLTTDGDIISIHVAGKSTSLAGTGFVTIVFNTSGTNLGAALGSNPWFAIARIQRIDANNASIAIGYWQFGNFSFEQTYIDNTVDWTTIMDIEVKGIAPTSGIITMTQLDINKELI